MSSVYSIKCPKCAAPLRLMGGGRVETITCAYCKSVIDLNDNYKILSDFKNASRPNVPFKIGMQGEINRVEYTIIGLVYYETTLYPLELWSDFLLFSPLYGYAWLTYENGHMVFSRRTRDFPNLLWSEIPLKSSTLIQNHLYNFYSSYDATIQYVEGELTWIAKKGDKTSFVDLINPPYGISAERSKKEIEYYKSEYLNAKELYQAFNVPKEQQKESKSFNPLKPFSKPLLHSLSKISMFVLLIIGFVLLGLHLDGEGKEILKMDASNQSVSKGDFTLNSTKYLLAIELSTGTYKSNNHSTLNNFNIKLQQNSKNIFTLNSQNGYIFNEEGVIDKRLSSWESRAKKVIAYIKLKQTGNYQLYITPVNKKVASNVTVNVKEQSARSYYIIYFAILTFIAFLLYYFYYMRYKSQLNQESDNPNHSFSLNGEVIFWIFVVIVIIISGLGE